MSRAIKFRNSTYLDSTSVMYKHTRLDTILDRFMWGKCHEATVKDSYVKLFTVDLPEQWKTVSILFMLTCTQNGFLSALSNLQIEHASTSDTMVCRNFKVVNFGSYDSTTCLIGVITTSTRIEVYCKMGTSMSPTINIISISKLRRDNYGIVTLDMNTVVSTLPSGTQIKPTKAS